MSEQQTPIFDAEYQDKQPQKKPKKNHSPMKLVIVTSIVSGLIGGSVMSLALNHATGTTIVYKDSASSTTKTTSSSSASELSTSEIAAKAGPSVVEINVTGTTTSYGMFGGTYETQAAGSGVIISSDGYIITNNHVVEDGDEINVVTSDGKSYEATLVATDAKSDIGVLKIEATDLTAAVIGDSDKIQVGDKAVVIGNPLGTLGGTVTDGIISATNREITINNESMNLLQTNAAINSGNSGGGLFDGNGNLIGIVNAKDSGTTSSGTTIEGLGFAIPINDAMNVAQQLIENGKVTDRATLGVYVQELQQDQGNYKAGLYITSLVKNGAAENAGLQVYDRIVKVNGEEISSYSDLSAVLNKKKVGDEIEVVVERSGDEKTFTVSLTSSNN